MNSFEGAFEAIKAVWGLLPAAIGDLAFQAANSLIEGVEAMLNGVVSRINGFIEGVNAGLEALGVERRIGLIADLDLGRLENRFAVLRPRPPRPRKMPLPVRSPTTRSLFRISG